MKITTLIGLIVIGFGCWIIHAGLGFIYCGIIIALPSDES